MNRKEATKKRSTTKRRRPVAKKAALPPAPAPRRRARRARRRLIEAPPEQCFWVNFGPVLKNLRELRDALTAGMSDAQFAHHVGAGRNDFAAWVEGVLHEPQCARALRRARTRAAAGRAVEAALARR